MTKPTVPRASEGVGIRCTECGAHFPLQTLADAVLCPHCGTRQALTDPAHHQARRYRDRARVGLDAAAADREQASAWARRTSSRDKRNNLALAVIGIATLVLLGFAVVGVVESHTENPGPVPSLLLMPCSVAFTLAMLGGPLVYMWARRREHNSQGTTLNEQRRERRVACPHCGAPNPLRPGHAVLSCTHCRGALMPSRTAMVHALDAVRQERRRAALARLREERASTSRAFEQSSTTASTYMPVMLAAALAPPLLIMPAALILFETETLRERVLYSVGFLGVLVPTVALVGWFLLRARSRRRALRDSLEDLATQFHGHASTQMRDWIDWLNTYWAADYPAHYFTAGSSFGVVSLDAWGYPAALAINPTHSSFNANQPTYVEVILAAWIPGITPQRPIPSLGEGASAILHSLRTMGFEVTLTESGLLASATPRTVSQLRRTPDALHDIAPVAAHLARLAHELQAQPVPPTA